MSRLSVDHWAMQLAGACAQRSTCLRRAVGCVLLDEDNHVLATGYNGVASGLPHCNEAAVMGTGRKFLGQRNVEVLDKAKVFPHACPGAQASSGTQLDGCHAIHAEQNALLQCRDVREIHTCYCTTSPCMTCVKLLLNTGCRRIVFRDEYPHTEARALWEASGRAWERIGSELSAR